MFGIGVQELLVVLVIALIVFGGKKLPQIGADMGRALINFKNGTSERPVDQGRTVERVEKQEEIKNQQHDHSTLAYSPPLRAPE